MTKVRLLECEPELGLRVPADRIGRARTDLAVQVITLEPGAAAAPLQTASRNGMGYLVIDGLLAREMIVAGRMSAELLSEGDILQPRGGSREDALVRYHLQWHVLDRLRLAVLDDEFAARAAQFPQVISALLERAVRRTHRMSLHTAILQLSPVETRLLVMFWYFAERWGRVTSEGIVIRLQLSHQLLSTFVGTQRASVTTALHRVQDSGRLSRRDDGLWVLHGDPPDELHRVHWDPRVSATVVPV